MLVGWNEVTETHDHREDGFRILVPVSRYDGTLWLMNWIIAGYRFPLLALPFSSSLVPPLSLLLRAHRVCSHPNRSQLFYWTSCSCNHHGSAYFASLLGRRPRAAHFSVTCSRSSMLSLTILPFTLNNNLLHFVFYSNGFTKVIRTSARL